MNKNFAWLLLLSCCCITAAMAQSKKKKKEEPKPPVFNYVIDDPMDKFKAQPDAPPVYYSYTVPEFYYPKPRKHKDTTFEFFCYDVHDSLMAPVVDYDSVFFYSLYKSYVDSQHTYVDNQGVKQLLPVSSIIRRYDRVGREKWMIIEYPGNKYVELRAIKKMIVASDTEKVYNAHGDNTYCKVYNYYRLIP